MSCYFCWAVLLVAVAFGSSGCGQSAATEQTSPRQKQPESPGDLNGESPPVAIAVKRSAATDSPTSPDGQPTTTLQAAATPATSSETAKGQRPPADRGPTRPGDAEKITFDDLNLGMQADIVFREFMISDRVHDLEGKRISIVGYMHPPETQRGIKKFILLKNTQCKFGPGGQADHLADVSLRADHSTVFTPSPLKIEGTLRLAPFQGPDGNTWSIYRLEDALVR